MGLVRTVEPSDTPVCVDDAMRHLRIDEEDDAADLAGYIAAATRYAEQYLGRQIVSATWKYTLDAFPDEDVIELPRPPLVSVTSVQYVDTDGATQTFSSSNYSVLTTPTPGRISLGYEKSWPDTREQDEAVTITYVAGYGAAESVPASIKQAILMLVGHWYERREASSVVAVTPVPMAVDSLLWCERHLEIR